MVARWPKWFLWVIPLLVFMILRSYSLIAALVGFGLTYFLVFLAWTLSCKPFRASFFLRALWPSLPVLLIFLWIWLLKKLPLSQATITLYAVSSNVLTMVIIGIVSLIVYSILSRNLVCAVPEGETVAASKIVPTAEIT